ncbi:Predicted arabinose efflux permease, MFS family [Mesobacillus persicus]|uniref:Predicted arabinose efflux permease, MFS family n=1 Tax=Mesobacillus persicus TaxID=930146 RepID=A0A1H8ASL8_9BACI|nr:MFS transporter [Mesobacillus persicus]SEM72517.1 Predicted arabinose efflux permease, MFS family [Mesobacillus persicus]
MGNTRERLWTKDFILLFSINFFLTFIFYLLMVTMAVYAMQEFDASTSVAGLVAGIFIIGEIIARFYIGRKIEKIGRKKVLMIGLLLLALTTPLYFINLGIAVLLTTRFVHGIAVGIAGTAAGTIVAQIIPRTRKGEGIGFFSMSIALAAAFGPFIGLYLSQHATYEVIFSLCFGLGLMSLVTAFFLYVPDIEGEQPETSEKRGFQLANFLEPRALPIALITLMVAFCYSSVLSYINFYALERDLVEAASLYFIVYSIVILLSRPFTGRLMDAKGANYVMYPAFFLFAAGMIVLSTATTTLGFLFAAMLIGLGFGNIQSCAQAIAVKLTAPHRMGFATSTYFNALDGGLGLGPYVIGFIIPLIGYSSLYTLLGFFILFTAIPYYFLHGKKDHFLVEKPQASASV